MSYEIFNEDCLEGMKRLPDNSVDCIIDDLPYNLTDCAWDKGVIDLEALWAEFKRVLKPYNSAVLFASGKFTHKLIASNLDWYKYKWIWVKNAPTMFVHAKNAPMRKFEEILIFSDGVINHASCSKRRMKYNPQGVVPCCEVIPPHPGSDIALAHGKFRPPHKGANVATRGIFKVNSTQSQVTAYGGRFRSDDGKDKPTQLRAGGRGSKWTHNTDKVSDVSLQGGKLKGNWREDIQTCYGDCGNQLHAKRNNWYIQEQTGYPMDVIEFDVVPNQQRDHPTQKPVALLEYLIRTYTNEGELVLDATMGSGSTGVACMNTNRRFIGFETETKFFDIARRRIDEAIALREQSLFKLEA